MVGSPPVGFALAGAFEGTLPIYAIAGGNLYIFSKVDALPPEDADFE